MANRVTKIAAESLVPADPNVRATEISAESLLPADPNVRVTELAAEAHVAPIGGPGVRVTEIAVESFVPLTPVGIPVGDVRRSRSGAAPAMLMDIRTSNEKFYFWGTHQGTFPARVIGSDAVYQPFLVSAGPFQFSRTLRSDGGSIVVQNISGNTIERDLMKIIQSDEFEGALAVFRLYDYIAGVRFEFHGTLSAPQFDQTKASFQLAQIFDTNGQNVPFRQYSNLCTRTFKSPRCGSTGTATMCPKTVSACKDPRRAAFHRFDGVQFQQPLVQVSSLQYSPALKPGFAVRWSDRRLNP